MGALQIAKKRRQRHFYIGGSCRMTRLRLALRVVAAGGSVVSLRETRTCCRCTRLILRLTLRANAIALFKIVPDNFVESFISQIAKKRRQRHFYIGGSCRMTRFARPSGRRRKRLRYPAHPDNRMPHKIWWVVQDDSASPRPSGRRRRRLRCLTAFDPNLLQVRIFYIADSKKAPLGRFFTLVGRAGFEPATN